MRSGRRGLSCAVACAAALAVAGRAEAADDAAACRDGDAAACVRLADAVKDENPALRMAWLRLACDAGDSVSCGRLDALLEEGIETSVRRLKRRARIDRPAPAPTPEDVIARGLRRAATVFDGRCRRGEGDSCYQLASMLEAGEGMRRDLPRAAELYAQACDAGVRHGCSEGGRLFAAGGARFPRDPVRAAGLYRRACTRDLDASCWSLGRLAERGDGVPKDEARARALYATACNARVPAACRDLADMELAGRGGSLDPETAIDRLDASCASGDRHACVTLASIYEVGYGVARDLARALDLYTRACTLGDAAACSDASLLRDSARDE